MKQVTLPTTAAKHPEPQPAAAPAPPARPQGADPWWAWPLRLFVPPLLTAGLLWLCFFPMAWGWLAWVAVVPLLTLLRSRMWPWATYFAALLGGLAFYLPVLRWMPVADDRMSYAWLALSLYCSLYFCATLLLVRWLERRTPLPLVVTLPVVWVSLEYLRSFLMTGFAWYFLGHTQHAFLPIIQVCDLGGVYMVSLLVAAANAWVFEVLYALPGFRRALGQQGPGVPPLSRNCLGWRRLALHGGAVAVLVMAALVYGVVRMDQDESTRGPRIALLQSNVDQRIRNTPLTAGNADSRGMFNGIVLHMTALYATGLDSQLNAEMVVWPETSYPADWKQTSPAVPTRLIPQYWADWETDFRKDLQTYVGSGRRPTLLGLNTEVLTEVEEKDTGRGFSVSVDKKRTRYNSALMVHGNGGVGQRYDKIHRVPFGEYMPLRDWLPFVDRYAPYKWDYSITPGDELTRFELGQYCFGVLICYEDSDPFLARQYAVAGRDGRAVDFLIDMSNDGWFDGSSEHEDHLALCRFRAIEARRAVARSVNMGISAVIDGNGRVLKTRETAVLDPLTKKRVLIWSVLEVNGQTAELPVSEWSKHKKVAGVVVANIPIDHRFSLYAHLGDWLPIGGWSVLGLVLVGSVVGRLRAADPAVRGREGNRVHAKGKTVRDGTNPAAPGGAGGADVPGGSGRVTDVRKQNGLPGESGG